MTLFLKNISDEYEISSLARMLFPKIRLGEYCEENCLAVTSEKSDTQEVLTVSLFADGKSSSQAIICPLNEDNTLPLGRLMYSLTQMHCNINMRWGILTGIRPIKLFHKQIALNKSDAEVLKYMQERYSISTEMAELSIKIAHCEKKVNDSLLENGFSLYVSIPFCPKRCSYCSFISESVERNRSLLKPYVEMLCKEIALTAETAKAMGLTLQTIYIGGGTPTILEHSELFKVLDALAKHFDLSELLEYTVEAGRPDTIDREKLLLLKDFKVDRISINPQTMNDKILKSVNRNHTAKDIVAAFYLAKEIGFKSINMDLIAGLPNDTPLGFSDSVSELCRLSPENITVHSLTVKRASELAKQNIDELYKKQQDISVMVDSAREMLMQNSYHPYYLYRQKGSIGNLDNTGYAKNGHDCIYNILMMDETQTVLTAGASAVTKYRSPAEQITRIFAHTLPLEYIKDFDRIKRTQHQILANIGDFQNNSGGKA